MSNRLIITIDGPAGTGKSTVAHRLARRFGLEFLDTGAMYRAAALLAIEQGIAPAAGAELAAALTSIDLRFDWAADPPALLMDGRDVSDRIREMDVSEQVSIVAGQSAVRDVLVSQQRRIAADHPRLVSEGRDQGSVVFPDANVRIYLDASAGVRAKRRHDQVVAQGRTISFEEVLHDVERRDALDSTRSVAPLVKPHGAICIETDGLNLAQVVDRLEAVVRERIPAELLAEETAAANGEST